MNYTWYANGDQVMGHDSSLEVTAAEIGKTLSVEVTVDGYTGSCTWEAEAAVVAAN